MKRHLTHGLLALGLTLSAYATDNCNCCCQKETGDNAETSKLDAAAAAAAAVEAFNEAQNVPLAGTWIPATLLTGIAPLQTHGTVLAAANETVITKSGKLEKPIFLGEFRIERHAEGTQPSEYIRAEVIFTKMILPNGMELKLDGEAYDLQYCGGVALSTVKQKLTNDVLYQSLPAGAKILILAR